VEFDLLVDGYKWREKHEMRQRAWSCANLMNMWRDSRSRMITPEMLLPTDVEPAVEDSTQRETDLSEVRAMLAPEGAPPTQGALAISEAAFEAAWTKGQARAAKASVQPDAQPERMRSTVT
jgi:hypothetical protein